MHRDPSAYDSTFHPTFETYETRPSPVPRGGPDAHGARPRCATHGLLIGPSGDCPRCTREDTSSVDRRVLRFVAFVGLCLAVLCVVARIGFEARDSITAALSRTSATSAGAGAAASAESDGRLVVYTSASCSYCRTAKAWLDARGIAYEERNVEDGAAYAEMRRFGSSAVPTFAMNGKVVQKGFDPTWQAVLKVLGEHGQAPAPSP